MAAEASSPGRGRGRRAASAAHPMSLSDFLVRRTLSYIEEEQLRPGDCLPSMRALAERFAVATPTLREAFRRLEAHGVLEIRHGSGVYVRSGRERILIPNSSYRSVEPAAVLNLLDARLLIEPHLAELAAASITAVDLEELGTLLDDAEQHLNDDAILHSLNMRFHCATARSSGNSVLAQTIESYVELYSTEQMSVLSLYDSDGRPRDQEDHRAIWRAIRDRDGTRARHLMHEHLLGVKTLVEQRITPAF
ncbi:FadR/GntR family transcriptional regulator [Pseudonocardia sichuanensis]